MEIPIITVVGIISSHFTRFDETLWSDTRNGIAIGLYYASSRTRYGLLKLTKLGSCLCTMNMERQGLIK